MKQLILPNEDEVLNELTQEGSLLVRDLRIISAFARNAKRIFEIGTLNGRTTLNLARFSPEDAEVYTLDIKVRNQDHRHPEASKIHYLVGDSVTYDFFRPFLINFDLVFVDGDHTQPYVVSDTRIALQLAFPDGYVLWHDWKNEHNVSRFVEPMFQNSKRKPIQINADLAYFTFQGEEVFI